MNQVPVTRAFKAARGAALRCKGWRQEAILRMLENNLENAERPEDLVIYASSAKAARNWASYDRIVQVLKTMEEDETLVVESGKPIGVFRTFENSPRVLIVNGVTSGALEHDELLRLIAEEKLMLGGMTAGCWQYIGSQGIIQGSYETFMAAARAHFGGTLLGRTILTAGCGGMGGAQPLAGVMAGASILVADAREQPIRRRMESGYLEHMTHDIDAAIDAWQAAAAERRPSSIAVVANIVDVIDRVQARGIRPDIATDQCQTDLRVGYYPHGISVEETQRLRREDPQAVVELGKDTMRKHVLGLLRFKQQGTITFEYGNSLMHTSKVVAGVENSEELGHYMVEYIRPMFCEGIGPFRWIAISGNPDDIWKIDDKLRTMFADVPRITGWLENARRIQFTGLPARICWLDHAQRLQAVAVVNAMVRSGELSGPISFTRDHHDSGGASLPRRENYQMKDGSSHIIGWAILNALLNASSGADLVAVHGHGLQGIALSAGLTFVADGSASAEERLQRLYVSDTGIGVLRYADAGYELAQQAAERWGLGL